MKIEGKKASFIVLLLVK